MILNISGRDMTVRNDLRTITEKRIAKLEKFFDATAEVNVIYSKKRNMQNAEITVFDKGTIFRSEVEGETFNNSLDEAIDVSYFFGEGAESVKINSVQYPDAAVIARCTMMHDSGARTEQMLEMWARVKGEVVKPWVLIVIGLTLVMLLVIGIRRKVNKYRSSRKYRRRRQRK